MTDRELLEFAAKAAGIVYERRYVEPMGVQFAGLLINIGIANRPAEFWNPLKDDGDALRLAVKLGLLFKLEFVHFLGLERFGGQERDDYAATRRAIVRAAAEIGKAMP